jgi:hypothetical protein
MSLMKLKHSFFRREDAEKGFKKSTPESDP